MLFSKNRALVYPTIIRNMSKRSRSPNSKYFKKAKSDMLPIGVKTDQLNFTNYYFEDGQRKVYPYYFTFQTNCKGRWIGRKLIDVYKSEFRLYTSEEYEKKVEKGHLRVNRQSVSLDYVLRSNDYMESKVHRHETPVNLSPGVEIVHQDDRVVIVQKPSSIPVHPCGNFRYNSLLFILAKEHGINNLFSVHRIDRLTSGLVIFAKTPEALQQIQGDILNKVAHKEYLCLLDGVFPRDRVHCEQPIKVHSFKIGISAISNEPGSKECSTTFERLAVFHLSSAPLPTPDFRTTGSLTTLKNDLGRGRFVSLVRCIPRTGRTHQIRVHAQYLGHPVLNDPLYNTELGWGPTKGRGAVFDRTIGEIIRDLTINGRFTSEAEPDGGTTEDSSTGLPLPLTLYQTIVRAILDKRLLEQRLSSILTNETLVPKTIISESPSDLSNGCDESFPIGTDIATKLVSSGDPMVPQAVAHPLFGTSTDTADSISSRSIHTATTLVENVAVGDGGDEGSCPELADSVRATLSRLETCPDNFLQWFDPECEDCLIILRSKLEAPQVTGNTEAYPGRPEQPARRHTRPFVIPEKHGIELPMYLHCFKYSGQGWSYQTSLPPWADPAHMPAGVVEAYTLPTETSSSKPPLVPEDYNVSEGTPPDLGPGDTVYMYREGSSPGFIDVYPDGYNPLLRHLTKNT